jgi:hypothetical protein
MADDHGGERLFDRTSGAGGHLGGAPDSEVLVTTLKEVAAPGIV